MNDIDYHLRGLLRANSTIASLLDVNAPGTIQQNKIDQSGPDTRIYFVRTGSVNDRLLSGNSGLIETTYDVECHSDDIDTSLTLAAAVKTVLDGIRDDTFKASFVDNHDDYYQPKGDYSDRQSLHVSSLQVTIFS